MIRHLLPAAALLAVAASATAAPPVIGQRVTPALRPGTTVADLHKALPATLRMAPAPAAAKLDVLRKGGIVVRDLPVGPPHVTVAKPVDHDLSLSFYGIFGADAGLDFAQFRDRQGFIALNWQAGDGAVYLVDCELPGGSTTTKVEIAVDGGTWLPATIAGGHLLYAVPPLPAYPGYSTHAFAMRSTGSGFHGCEVSKVK